MTALGAEEQLSSLDGPHGPQFATLSPLPFALYPADFTHLHALLGPEAI